MSQKIILTNDFHRTSAAVIPQPIAAGRFAGYHKISRRTALRLRAQLCGNRVECTCGGNFGERGGAHLDVCNEDYDDNYIIDLRASNI